MPTPCDPYYAQVFYAVVFGRNETYICSMATILSNTGRRFFGLTCATQIRLVIYKVISWCKVSAKNKVVIPALKNKRNIYLRHENTLFTCRPHNWGSTYATQICGGCFL